MSSNSSIFLTVLIDRSASCPDLKPTFSATISLVLPLLCGCAISGTIVLPNCVALTLASALFFSTSTKANASLPFCSSVLSLVRLPFRDPTNRYAQL